MWYAVNGLVESLKLVYSVCEWITLDGFVEVYI